MLPSSHKPPGYASAAWIPPSHELKKRIAQRTSGHGKCLRREPFMFKFLIFSLLLHCFCKIIPGLAYRTIQHQDDGVGSVFHHTQDWILDLGDMTKVGCYFIFSLQHGRVDTRSDTSLCVWCLQLLCLSFKSRRSISMQVLVYYYVQLRIFAYGRIDGSIEYSSLRLI